ncbi:MAG: class I SAM-dependent methyltransferase [Legionellaceae bacterium]|nr:class I SAM-dependent methyltransferase [Legionellaceae bacterium]
MFTKESLVGFLRGTLNFQEGSDATIEPVKWRNAPARQKDFLFPSHPDLIQNLSGLSRDERLLRCLYVDSIDYLDVFSSIERPKDISDDKQTVVVSFGCGGAEEIGALLMMYPNLKYIGLDTDKKAVEYNNILWANVPNIFFMQADMSNHSEVLRSLAGSLPDLILMIHPAIKDVALLNKTLVSVIPRISKDTTQVCITCLFNYEVRPFISLIASLNKNVYSKYSIRERTYENTSNRRQRNGTIFSSTVVPMQNIIASTIASSNIFSRRNDKNLDRGADDSWGESLLGLKGKLS